MAKVTTIEVKVIANPSHQGIVDIRSAGTDHTGAIVGSNGMRWKLA